MSSAEFKNNEEPTEMQEMRYQVLEAVTNYIKESKGGVRGKGSKIDEFVAFKKLFGTLKSLFS